MVKISQNLDMQRRVAYFLQMCGIKRGGHRARCQAIVSQSAIYLCRKLGSTEKKRPFCLCARLSGVKPRPNSRNISMQHIATLTIFKLEPTQYGRTILQQGRPNVCIIFCPTIVVICCLEMLLAFG